jgi:hypothetical protein
VATEFNPGFSLCGYDPFQLAAFHAFQGLRHPPCCFREHESSLANTTRNLLLPTIDPAQLMSDRYDPLTVESGKYDWWNRKGFFEPQFASDGRCSSQGVFVVPLPPPTVNGSLHLGHALTVTIEDVLSRWFVLLSCPPSKPSFSTQ